MTESSPADSMRRHSLTATSLGGAADVVANQTDEVLALIARHQGVGEAAERHGGVGAAVVDGKDVVGGDRIDYCALCLPEVVEA